MPSDLAGGLRSLRGRLGSFGASGGSGFVQRDCACSAPPVRFVRRGANWLRSAVFGGRKAGIHQGQDDLALAVENIGQASGGRPNSDTGGEFISAVRNRGFLSPIYPNPPRLRPVGRSMGRMGTPAKGKPASSRIRHQCPMVIENSQDLQVNPRDFAAS